MVRDGKRVSVEERVRVGEKDRFKEKDREGYCWREA